MNHEVRIKNNPLGAVYAATAYLLWGISPFYWHTLSDVPPLEIISHRIVWSSVTMMVVLIMLGRFREFVSVMRNFKMLKLNLITAVLIGINWLIFIYSVNYGHTVDASLGYFLCPLVTVAFAAVILKEELTRGQYLAVALAAVGVLLRVIESGIFPWIAIVLSVTFALYGLLRKQMKVDALIGLAIETVILFLPAVILLGLWHFNGQGAFLRGSGVRNLLLFMAGIVTMTPLLFYSMGVRIADLSLVGFLQYIGPTLQLLSAVFFFGEAFTKASCMSFGIIWLGLLVFIWDSFHRRARNP